MRIVTSIMSRVLPGKRWLPATALKRQHPTTQQGHAVSFSSNLKASQLLHLLFLSLHFSSPSNTLPLIHFIPMVIPYQDFQIWTVRRSCCVLERGKWGIGSSWVSTEIKTQQEKENQKKKKKTHPSANDLIAGKKHINSNGPDSWKKWSSHEEMLLFKIKQAVPKLFMQVWFKALFVGVDAWPQSDWWENKRSTAAEVIRETRCQMSMMGNI